MKYTISAQKRECMMHQRYIRTSERYKGAAEYRKNSVILKFPIDLQREKWYIIRCVIMPVRGCMAAVR